MRFTALPVVLLLASSAAQADPALILVEKAKGPKGSFCERVEEGAKKTLAAAGLNVQELKLKKGQEAGALAKSQGAQAWVHLECTAQKKKTTAKLEAFWGADGLSFAAAAEPYAGKADAERAGAKLAEGVVDGLKRASTPVALPTATPPPAAPTPPPRDPTPPPAPAPVAAAKPEPKASQRPMIEIAAGAGTRAAGAYAVVVQGSSTRLAYSLDPLLLIQASARFNVPSTGLGVEASFSFSPVKFDLTKVVPAPTPGDPSGSFLGIGGTLYYRLVLSGMNEGKKTGFALEPLAGVMFESFSVTAQSPALVLSSSAIIPHFGARGVLRATDSLELRLDARFRLPLGTSESPNKTGDPGLGIGLAVGAGAQLWLTSFLGLGLDAAYEYASVSFSGTGDRQRFIDDPPLVNASVATSALKVNLSALLAF